MAQSCAKNCVPSIIFFQFQQNKEYLNPNPKLWQAVATPAFVQRIKDCLALPKALPLESPAFFRHPKYFVDQSQWLHDKVLLSTIATLGVALLEG